jgi:hypothetical protein
MEIYDSLNPGSRNDRGKADTGKALSKEEGQDGRQIMHAADPRSFGEEIGEEFIEDERISFDAEFDDEDED